MSADRPVRFVIFAAPRTGSNLLCGLLNAHPDILCHHGLFNPGGVHWARDRRGSGGVADRDRDPVAFLDSVWASGGDASFAKSLVTSYSKIKCFRFVIPGPPQVEPGIQALAREPGFRIAAARRPE